MGTSEFAVPVLEALVAKMNQNFDSAGILKGEPRTEKQNAISIVGVYTKPPSLQGKGLKIQNSVIHNLADKLKLDVFTPETFKNQVNIKMLKYHQPDVIVVASYGLILRQEVLDIPTYGCINVHPSSLPRWRGAAPIQRMLMAGDSVSDVCIMQMDSGLDTGDIILRQEVAIDPEINATDLTQKLAEIGGEMVLEVLDQISLLVALGRNPNEEMKKEVQSKNGVTYAHKIEKNDRVINWNEGAKTIHCQVRGLAEKPGAYFIDSGKIVKVLKTRLAEKAAPKEITKDYQPGDFIFDKGKGLYVVCGDGQVLELLLLQREGKAVCDGLAFAAGCQNKLL